MKKVKRKFESITILTASLISGIWTVKTAILPKASLIPSIWTIKAARVVQQLTFLTLWRWQLASAMIWRSEDWQNFTYMLEKPDASISGVNCTLDMAAVGYSDK